MGDSNYRNMAELEAGLQKIRRTVWLRRDEIR